MRTLVVAAEGVFRNDVQVADISDWLDKPEAVLWLDVEAPDQDDVALLRDEFHLHPLAIEDAVRSHERPKVESYNNYYLIIFYAVDWAPDAAEITLRSLSLFIGSNYVISVHRGPVREVRDTLERWQRGNTQLSRVGSLIHALLDGVVDNYFPVMDHVADHTEELEDVIFSRFNQSAIQAIFSLKKNLLRMRHVVAPERDVMNTLLRREIPVFGDQDMAYLQDVYDHVVRVTDSVDTYRDLLGSAVESYLSLQSNRLNEIVKVLTIASIVLMSNSVIAGIYGMNFVHMPELAWRYGYPWALGLMAVISLGLVGLFRRLRWI